MCLYLGCTNDYANEQISRDPSSLVQLETASTETIKSFAKAMVSLASNVIHHIATSSGSFAAAVVSRAVRHLVAWAYHDSLVMSKAAPTYFRDGRSPMCKWVPPSARRVCQRPPEDMSNALRVLAEAMLASCDTGASADVARTELQVTVWSAVDHTGTLQVVWAPEGASDACTAEAAEGQAGQAARQSRRQRARYVSGALGDDSWASTATEPSLISLGTCNTQRMT